MLLSMMDYGDKKSIAKVNGKEDTRRFLESLGFVEGAEVSVVNRINGNVIVNVKNSRIAISNTVANKIIV